jgi:hypothetical protein
MCHENLALRLKPFLGRFKVTGTMARSEVIAHLFPWDQWRVSEMQILPTLDFSRECMLEVSPGMGRLHNPTLWDKATSLCF